MSELPSLLAMLLLIVLTGAWLTRPLWRRSGDDRQRRRQANVLAYQTRIAEIDAEHLAGQLNEETRQALHDEASVRLLQDAGGVDTRTAVVAPRRRIAALLIALLLSVMAVFIYWRGDTWRTQQLIELAQRDPDAAEQRMLGDMIVRLEKRLHDQPDDAEGWAMLGRAYLATQRPGDAEQAYARANLLSVAQPQPEWLVSQGEAHGLADPQRRLLSVRLLFEQALKLQPDNTKALFYGGLAAVQAGDDATAYERWLKLRDQPLPDEVAAVVDERLPELAQRAGRKLPTTPAVAAVRQQITVRLADSLQSQLKPGMTLMVFAKADGGPPMPLAVQRIDSPQLPVTVTLDDGMAMLPSMKLSAFERWVITARLTSGAGAQALSGDLEGSHPARRADAARPLEVVIDHRVP